MTTFTRPLLTALVGAALLGTSLTATAATPASGTVSKSARQVMWSGETTGSGVARQYVEATDSETDPPCQAPYCDPFTLQVADSDKLTLRGRTSNEAGAGTFRVRKPDGSVTIFSGPAGNSAPLTATIDKAATGAYGIEWFISFVDGPVEYTADATLGALDEDGNPATAPAPAPAPAPGPAPAPAPAGAPKQDLSVTVKGGKLSAKKANKARKASFTFAVSRAVTSVSAALKKGSKVVGKGSTGAVASGGKVTLKLSKKLKTGSYSLTLVASTGDGVQSVKRVAVKVTK